MTAPQSQAAMQKLFADVITGVVSAMKQEFENEGIDEQILVELQNLWELKLKQMLEETPDDDDDIEASLDQAIVQTPAPSRTPGGGTYDAYGTYIPPTPAPGSAVDQVDGAFDRSNLQTISNTAPHTHNATDADNTQRRSAPTHTDTNIDTSLDSHTRIHTDTYYTLAPTPTDSNAQTLADSLVRTISAHGIAPTSTRTLTRHEIDAQMLHRYTEAQVQATSDDEADEGPSGDVRQMRGTITLVEMAVPQVDGLDEDDDGSDLGADLDSDDDEPQTDNIILCQYDKVTRTKQKWKATLKNGMMRINNREYVFHKAIGEFEW